MKARGRDDVAPVPPDIDAVGKPDRVLNTELGGGEVVMVAVPTGMNHRPFGQSAVVLFKVLERFDAAVSAIYINYHDPRIGTGRNPDISARRFAPPPPNRRLVRRGIFDAMWCAWVLARV